MTAPAELEPYTVSLRLTVPPEIPSPSGLVATLLEDIARRCDEAGCSVIGHIKCHARAAQRKFSCGLTTRRSGATCRGAGEEPVTPGEVLEVDLAVLVYGLSRVTIETIVIESLAVAAPGAEVDAPGESGVANHDHLH